MKKFWNWLRTHHLVIAIVDTQEMEAINNCNAPDIRASGVEARRAATAEQIEAYRSGSHPKITIDFGGGLVREYRPFARMRDNILCLRIKHPFFQEFCKVTIEQDPDRP